MPLLSFSFFLLCFDTLVQYVTLLACWCFSISSLQHFSQISPLKMKCPWSICIQFYSYMLIFLFFLFAFSISFGFGVEVKVCLGALKRLHYFGDHSSNRRKLETTSLQFKGKITYFWSFQTPWCKNNWVPFCYQQRDMVFPLLFSLNSYSHELFIVIINNN